MTRKSTLALFIVCCGIFITLGFAQPKARNRKTTTLPVPPFIIKAELSPIAEQKLRQIHEGVTVLAMFDGDALPGYAKYNAPMRDVYLGSEEISTDDTHIASFTNARISELDWTHLSDRDYFLTVNIFTSRKADRNNLLSCSVPEDHISKFANKTTTVKCRLISEDATTSDNVR